MSELLFFPYRLYTWLSNSIFWSAPRPAGCSSLGQDCANLWQSLCCKVLAQQGPWGCVRSKRPPVTSNPPVGSVALPFLLLSGEELLGAGISQEVKKCEELDATNTLQLTINSERSRVVGHAWPQAVLWFMLMKVQQALIPVWAWGLGILAHTQGNEDASETYFKGGLKAQKCKIT